jgi:hypothetical protein
MLYFHSDSVFVGEVKAEIESQNERKIDPGIFYEVVTGEWIKGKKSEVVRVFTERNSGAEYLEVGKRYIIFARYYDRAHPFVISCQSAIQIPAEDIMRELRQLGSSRAPGIIAGQVFNCETMNQRCQLERAHISVRSDEKTFRAVTDREGRFGIVLPPGRYHVTVRYKNDHFKPYVLSLDGDDVMLRPGQKTNIAFVTINR